jgi:hypothetical protein
MLIVLYGREKRITIMAKRIPLSENSFLAHLFSPKRNPQPSGIRKTELKGLKGGRTKARLNAFNRMSPFNQELLKRSGQRDAYLRGEATLADAKSSLRPKAIAQKLAKPLRTKTKYKPSGMTGLDRMIAEHLKKTVRAEGKNVNDRTVEDEIVWLDNGTEAMTGWSYGKIKYAGRKGSEYERVDSVGKTHNPFWYH